MNRISILIFLFIIIFVAPSNAQSWVWKYAGRHRIEMPKPNVYRYGNDNLRVDPKEYSSINLRISDFENYRHEDIAADINAQPSIHSLKLELNLLGSKKSNLPSIDFSAFRHIEYLIINTFKPLDTATWSSILDMPKLKYLSVVNQSIPEAIQTTLFDKLEGIKINAQRANVQSITGNLKEIIIERYKNGTNDKFSLSNLKNLQYLYISGDSLSYRLSREIENLHRVKELKIESNSSLDLRSMTQLKSVSINGASLSCKLPKSINSISISHIDPNTDLQLFLDQYHWIEKLKLSYKNPREKFNINIAGLSKLKDLNIMGKANSINLEGLVKLEKFENLLNDSLQTIVGLNAYQTLKRIDLYGCGLNKLPTEIYRCYQLQYLNIIRSQIQELTIPKNTWNNLEKLELRNSEISNFVLGRNALRKITKLDFSNTLLSNFKIDFSQTPDIKTIKLDNTCINTIDPSIRSLKHLEKFSYSKYKRSSLYDEKPRDLCLVYLDSFPMVFSEFENLKEVNISGQIGIAEQALSVLSQSQSDSLTLNVSSTGLKEIPKLQLDNCPFVNIDLSHNNISKKPIQLLQCPLKKINLNRNELGVLDRRANNESEVLLLRYDAGIISKEDLMATPHIEEALVEVASRHYSNPEENPILEYYPMALQLDSAYTVNKISKINFARALFEVKKFEQALLFYNVTIEEQLSRNIKFSNDIASNIKDRSEIHLHLGDTLSAIADLRLIEEEFSFDMEPQIFSLLMETGEYEDARTIATEVVEYYQDLIDSKRSSNLVGLQLSILEIHIVTDALDSYQNYRGIIDTSGWDANYIHILDYLDIVAKHNQATFLTDAQKFIIKMKENYHNESWNCGLVQSWAKQLSARKRNMIQGLNATICPNP